MIWTVPANLQARELFHLYQTRFFQTLALPKPLFDHIRSDGNLRAGFEFHSRWRLDYPIAQMLPPSGRHRQVLVVASELLSRGTVTLCSPLVEDTISRECRAADWTTADPRHCWSSTRGGPAPTWQFDGSGTEKTFMEDLLPGLLGPFFRQLTIPQVHFSSLIPKEALSEALGGQRVDFLITLPKATVAVELDGSEHEAHKSRDLTRSRLLQRAGIKTVSIRNEEVRSGDGPGISELRSLAVNCPQATTSCRAGSALAAIKLIHQLQLAAIEALLSGSLPWNGGQEVAFDSGSATFSDRTAALILETCENDLNEMLGHLCKLYDVTPPKVRFVALDGRASEGSITISLSPDTTTNAPLFVIQDVSFWRPLATHLRQVGPAQLGDVPDESLRYFMRYVFRHNDFRDGQLQTIRRALQGKDVISLLPTGGGKSAAFQLTSLLLPGVSIIISPIVALIDDQVDNLRRSGITSAVGITSQISDPRVKGELIRAFGQGQYEFCYVSPERFQTQRFRDTLMTLTAFMPIALIVVDEAHCVSEWGHDFRTAYLNIGRTSRRYCSFGDSVPPLMALTGTASSAVLRDVQRELDTQGLEASVTPLTFDRPELHYSVSAVEAGKKLGAILEIIEQVLPEKFGLPQEAFCGEGVPAAHAGIVFCPHVNGELGVMRIANAINVAANGAARVYAGGAPGAWPDEAWTDYKRRTAQEFKDSSFSLLVTTKSFGMGIDKPDIRYTVHICLPSSIESFYQEAGRAARGPGMDAECFLLYSNDHPERNAEALRPDATTGQIAAANFDMRQQDDISVALYFHSIAFQGVEAELRCLGRVLTDIGSLDQRASITRMFKGAERIIVEKALHRLLLIAIVDDYVIDYATGEFTIGLSGATQEQILTHYVGYVERYNPASRSIGFRLCRFFCR